ncbi:DUF1080 domain-containing protein [Oleiagrimonas sp. C23AA]|uniref:3-keto-disaccharide hydrolase n=1 Tax=Oleiagrimonas sp. C23AA TaxID=2719047 RepID=UPI001F1091E3|nr:DUF1080 domain-containing protein [Oleiagrimonas sp. C23AA]
MKHLVRTSLVSALMLAGLSAPAWARAPAAASASDAGGWQSLFNGRSLAGWHSYNMKGAASGWSVVDGAIHLQRTPDSKLEQVQDLITDASYQNFDLKLEWKMSPCADAGVMFNVHEDPKYTYTFETGVEMQIADLACTVPDSRVLYERAGDMFDLYAAPYESVRAAGQWNQIEIRVDHGHVQFLQNGKKTVDTHLWTAAWKQRVAKTKFATWPGFAKYHQGHISLQGTENKGRAGQPIQLWFRHIRIKRL